MDSKAVKKLNELIAEYGEAEILKIAEDIRHEAFVKRTIVKNSDEFYNDILIASYDLGFDFDKVTVSAKQVVISKDSQTILSLNL